RFTDSLYDLDEAIKSGYPNEQLTNLLPRRIKCLGNLNAIEKLESELISIQTLSKVFPKNSDLKELIRLCEKFLANEQKVIREEKSWIKLGATFVDIDINGSEELPDANRKIKLEKSAVKGNMLIANEKINQGEDLIKDFAICSVVASCESDKKCNECLLNIE